MSILDQVTTEIEQSPFLLIIYGRQGIGKSTFAASAPKPIILRVEDGVRQIKVTKTPHLTNYSMVMGALNDLLNPKYDYKTVVIDSLTSLEELVWKETCAQIPGNSGTIESFGFGKGYKEALKFWNPIRDMLTKLRNTRNMNVILTAHSQIKKISDPTLNAEYDKSVLSIHDIAANMWTRYVDAVLFAAYDIRIAKDGQKTKAFGDGDRFLYTEERPGQDSKNRFNLPYKIPLDWNAFEKATKQDVDSMKNECLELARKIPDKETQEKAIKHLDECINIRMLKAAEKRLKELAV